MQKTIAAFLVNNTDIEKLKNLLSQHCLIHEDFYELAEEIFQCIDFPLDPSSLEFFNEMDKVHLELTFNLNTIKA